jgi:Flp pilus assembly protein TadG
LPVLVLLMVGAIECSNLIFLRQSMVQAGYEAAKLASRPNARAIDAKSRAEGVLSALGISSGCVVLNPSVTEGLARGTDIQVTVTAPMNSNSLVPFAPFAGQSLSISMTSVKR